MHFLNELYEAFDGLVDDYDMYKLDIVGDCYIVVAGLIKEDQDGFVCVEELAPEQTTRNAHNILQFGKAMLRKARSKPVSTAGSTLLLLVLRRLLTWLPVACAGADAAQRPAGVAEDRHPHGPSGVGPGGLQDA